MLLNIDLHVHTDYSFDGKVSIEEVVGIARWKGLNGVAITDHNTIEGALRLKETLSSEEFVVIVGEEINSTEGEITGLFLKEMIPAGLSPEETIERIKLQDGLVHITHPFCRMRKSKLRVESLFRLVEKIDIIEVFNSRTIFIVDDRKAYEFARENNKAMAVGSDAHLPYEYGSSFIKIPPFDIADDFKRNLSTANLVTQRSPLWVHLITKLAKINRTSKS